VGPAKKTVILSLVAIGVLVALLCWNPEATRRSQPREALTVYCAAGLKPAVEPVAIEYERNFGVPIQVQYGGSGTLLSNLRVARRGDLFIAADESYMDLARSNRLVAEAIPLAHLVPMIAVRRGNPKNIRGLSDLLRRPITVVLANPDAAAIGSVVRGILQRSGEWSALASRVKAFKPTVNDVANDLKLGIADAGIVWDATTREFPELEAISVPEFVLASNTVAVGVLTFSRQPTEALRFARYLGARDRGLREFQRMGYQPVDGDAWAEEPAVVLFSGGVNRLAIEETLRRFEDREGARITRVYNGCGILVAQMKSGQQPDAFFSCDTSFLNPVRERFARVVEVCETDMVLLLPKGNPRNLRTLEDLAKAGLRLGVANAKQTALGALTERVLRQANVLDAVMANVKTQTPTADLLVNQMRAGSLDAVIVYLANTSQVRDLFDVVPLAVPGAVAVQPYAISRSSNYPHLMERLLTALRSTESQQRFESVGFRWRSGMVVP
jgi:molybdenum ABC transporter molybdate-binding protein